MHVAFPYIKMNQSSFICESCGKVFAVRKSYLRHLKNHEPPEDIPCEICGKTLASKVKLKDHIRKVHKDKAQCHI